MQREAVAACDAALDFVYYRVLASCYFTTAFATLLPLTPYNYIATLYPLVHVYGTARASKRSRGVTNATGAGPREAPRPTWSCHSATRTIELVAGAVIGGRIM